ncbi:hypothetical protein [Microbacterium sp. ANT_H45B]|nr:hypothetical protein [Microbacterium sp. ANT_H45B]
MHASIVRGAGIPRKRMPAPVGRRRQLRDTHIEQHARLLRRRDRAVAGV